MITYELAKKLKDAGLQTPYARIEQYYPDVNIPTLEELIEACGDKFSTLTNRAGNPYWRAWGITGEDVQGSTPEEAVANLYLELNKKNE